MTNTIADIDGMATVLTAISTASNDQIRTGGADNENAHSEPSVDQAASTETDLDAAEAAKPTADTTAVADEFGQPENVEPSESVRPLGDAVSLSGYDRDLFRPDTVEHAPVTKHSHAQDDGGVSSTPTTVIENMAGRPTTDVGGDIFKEFPAARRQPDEFQLPLCDLVIGQTSDGGVYDFDAGSAESLCHAVNMPETIAPIVVMKTGDAWHVIDGWTRVIAFRLQYGNTANVMVRVVAWDGTRNKALFDRFAATFLTLKSRKVDKSILLRQFHLAWSVPQLVLAARIGWIDSRVSRELAAAKTMQEAPRFAELHVKTGDPPLEYLYKVQQARDAGAADDQTHRKRAPENGAVAKLEARLEALLAKGEQFATAEALAKLGISKPAKGKATTVTSDTANLPSLLEIPQIIDCVEDSTATLSQ